MLSRVDETLQKSIRDPVKILIWNSKIDKLSYLQPKSEAKNEQKTASMARTKITEAPKLP